MNVIFRGIVLAILLAALTAPSVAVAQTEEPVDRGTLMELFDATDGGNWDRSDNWGSDLPLESWYGVSTDEDGRVVGLVLPSNGLSGELPGAISGLEALQHLDLGDNEVYGGMPAEIGNCPTSSTWT